jgi:addiction module RelE/StbE family toxin
VARKRPVFWTGPALDDLRAIHAHVSRDRPEAAKRLGRRLKESVLVLRDHPEIGRRVPELAGTGYREVIEPPYRVVYEVGEDRIVVLRVWHSSRSSEALEEELGSPSRA